MVEEPSKLTPVQADILARFVEHGPYEATTNLLEFQLASGASILVAIAKIDAGDEVFWGVLTLPTGPSGRVFFTITDGDPEGVAEVLAKVAIYDLQASLEFGHTISFSGSRFLRKHGREAVLLLDPDASNVMRGFPEEIEVGGGRYKCFLVVFLSADEYKRKISSGLRALLEDFQGCGRDLVKIDAIIH